MLHLQHFLLFIRREFSDYLFLVFSFVFLTLSLVHLVEREQAEMLGLLFFIAFLVLVMMKSGIRRLFYIHYPTDNPVRTASWITRDLALILLVSFMIVLLSLAVSATLPIFGYPEWMSTACLRTGFWLGLMIPPLLTEPAMSTISESGTATTLRIVSRLGMPGLTVGWFFFPVDALSMINLLIGLSAIRLMLFLILLIRYQLVDAFTRPVISWAHTLAQSARVLLADASLWLVLILVVFLIWSQAGPGYRMIWLVGGQLFVVFIMVAAQMLSLWSLIFKNFIRLGADSQFILYVQHLNTWHVALFFSVIPLFLLLLTPLIEFEMGGYQLPVNWPMLITSMTALAAGAFCFSNPLAELLVLLDRQRELTLFSVTSLVVFLLCGWLFTSIHGVWGWFLAPLAAGLVYWVGVNSQIQQLLSCDYKYIFPYRKLGQFILISLAALVSGYLVSQVTHRISLVFTAYLVVYLGLLALTKLIRTDKQTGFLNWTRQIGNFH